MSRSLETRLERLEQHKPRATELRYGLPPEQFQRAVCSFVDVLEAGGDYHVCPPPPAEFTPALCELFPSAWAHLAAAWDTAPEEERTRTRPSWGTT